MEFQLWTDMHYENIGTFYLWWNWFVRLIEEETTKTGKVAWKIYGTLIRYATVIGTVVTMLLHAVYTGFVLAANIWLSFWSEDHMHRNTDGTLANNNSTDVEVADNRHYRLGIYALLNLFQIEIRVVVLSFTQIWIPSSIFLFMSLKIEIRVL